MAHHLRSQRRSVDSAAAELESTAAEVDPAVADIKSAAAEVESRGGGAPISEGGGPRCFNRRRRSLNRRRFGGRRELASNLARTGLSFCSPSCCTASTLFVAGRIRSSGWTFAGLDTYLLRIGILFYLFFLPILHGYVSTAYPMHIRIGYVSDTGYAPSLAYRGNVEDKCQQVINVLY